MSLKEEKIPTIPKKASKNINLSIHLRGVQESKVSLTALTGLNSQNLICENLVLQKNETKTILVLKQYLPGTFILRFDYKENSSSNAYPSEKEIFLNDQNIDVWINPPFSNNPDSTTFQHDEIENKTFSRFLKDNNKVKEKIALLQPFLLNYDDIKSEFYQQAIKEYEKRRVIYNKWISDQLKKYQSTFVSTKFRFKYLPYIEWNVAETNRLKSIINNYFEYMDFNDPLLIKTTEIKEWMDQYVNLYTSLETSPSQKDSLLCMAGRIAIDKAKIGHPLVYGWMVDYFFTGFESNNISVGLKMLEPYISDSNCLTNKRQLITKRLTGLKALIPGIIAPDFILKDQKGKIIHFNEYKTNCRYKLILFWAAGCSHCTELVKKLYPWYQQYKNKKQVEIFTLSLDNTESDILTWKNIITKLPEWNHKLCKGGINSKEATAYYILSTPVMILVDPKSNQIIELPETINALSLTTH